MTTPRSESKEYKNECRITGITELDGFIEAGFSLVDVLQAIWAQAGVHKFKVDRENARLKTSYQAEKIGLAQIFLQQYITIVTKLGNQTWWPEVRSYILDQLNRFAFDNPIGVHWGSFSKSSGDQKIIYAEILFFLLCEYKLYLEQTNLHLDLTVKNEKLKKLDNILEYVNNSGLVDTDIDVDFQDYQDRIDKAKNLTKQCFNLIDAAEKKWEMHERFPSLRPGLLITAGNMFSIMLRRATEYIDNGIITKFFYESSRQQNVKQLICDLKHKLEIIAEVMLWQEQLYRQTKSDDLVLQLTNELHKILSPTLNHKEYNCLKLDCRSVLWNEVDLDLAKLFSQYAEENKQSGVLRYVEFLPKNNTVEGRSAQRCEFILLHGSITTKEILKKMIDEKSSMNVANRLAAQLYRCPDHQHFLKTLIDHYLRDHCQMTMMSREYMLQEGNVLTASEILIRFPKLKKTFDVKMVDEVAEQISTLQGLYLRIMDKNDWNKALILAENAKNIPYQHLLGKMTMQMQALLTQQEVKDSQHKSKQMIKKYLHKQYKLDQTTLSKLEEAKDLSNKFLHPEMTVLYHLYRGLNVKAVWMNALDIKLFSAGRSSKNYLDLLSRLICMIDNSELRMECNKQLRVCQVQYDKVILHNAFKVTYYLAAKYDHLDEFETFRQNLRQSREIRKEISQEIKSRLTKD